MKQSSENKTPNSMLNKLSSHRLCGSLRAFGGIKDCSAGLERWMGKSQKRCVLPKKRWYRRRDSNPHSRERSGFRIRRVYQFRHSGTESAHPSRLLLLRKQVCFGKPFPLHVPFLACRTMILQLMPLQCSIRLLSRISGSRRP